MDMRKKRKFLSEFGVSLCSSNWLMMPADQIQADGKMSDEQENISKNCHLYLVCRRPAVSYVHDSLTYKDGILSVTLKYKVEGVSTKIQFKNKFEMLDGAVDIRVTEYPHREIKTYNSNGLELRRLPASSLIIGLDNSHPLKKLEVLYVGQAFGNGSRSAIDRLKNHSTLQKILADTAHNYPDSEISVLMFVFEPYNLISSFDGLSKGVIDGKRDAKRFISIHENLLSLKQQIGLAEAGLIRYFQPEYNNIYKLSFPSPKLKLLKQCYELDFSALFVELNTDEYKFETYSAERVSSMHHICKIDLIDEDSRASFFYFPNDDGRMIKITDAIGVGKIDK